MLKVLQLSEWSRFFFVDADFFLSALTYTFESTAHLCREESLHDDIMTLVGAVLILCSIELVIGNHVQDHRGDFKCDDDGCDSCSDTVMYTMICLWCFLSTSLSPQGTKDKRTAHELS